MGSEVAFIFKIYGSGCANLILTLAEQNLGVASTCDYLEINNHRGMNSDWKNSLWVDYEQLSRAVFHDFILLYKIYLFKKNFF